MTRRTTLRAVEPAAASPPPPPPPPPQQPRGRANTSYVVGGALVALGLAVVGLVALLVSRPTPAATAEAAPTASPAVVAQVSAPVAQVSAPVAQVSGPAAAACPSIASFLEVIGSYERQAKWSLAASTAQTALRTPALCDADRSALGQKLVALGREALFEQPPAPEDGPGQRRVVTAYSDLKLLANQYGLQAPAPLPIAQSAYDNRLFLLAAAAYADAFTNADTSADDRAVVRADYAAQYNLGLIWAHRSDAAQRQDGLARLVTACRINEQYQLGSPEACDALQTLVGPRTRWPVPVGDPLINASGSGH